MSPPGNSSFTSPTRLKWVSVPYIPYWPPFLIILPVINYLADPFDTLPTPSIALLVYDPHFLFERRNRHPAICRTIGRLFGQLGLRTRRRPILFARRLGRWQDYFCARIFTPFGG